MHSLLKWVLGLFFVFSILLNVAILIAYSRRTPQCASRSKHAPVGKHDERSRVFADLTQDEYLQVQQYMLQQKDLDISTRQSTRPDENFLFLIDLHVPTKSEVLKYLDAQGPAPRREATVVVFYGARGFIKEYLVGPLPNPNSHRDVTRTRYGTELPLSARTVTIGEYMLMFQFLEVNVFLPLSTLMHESFGVDAQKKLNAFEQMPRGIRAGERKTWISFFRDLSGLYIQPVGFEVLVNHVSTNSSQWRVERVLYNGQYFMSVEELRDAYSAGTVKKIEKTPWEDYGSLKPRTRPLQLGPQLEAMSVYGSVTPGMGMTKFLDSSIGIGRFAHELVRGVDCPYEATYVDTYRYIDVPKPMRFRNSICIFELYLGQPLRRHFADFFHNSYGGMANSALVFRTITAIGNYDYMQSETRSPSGSERAGNIHTHFINFKVDLDVAGVKNMFQTKDMEFKNVSLPWMPEHYAMVPHLVEKTLHTEQRSGKLAAQEGRLLLHELGPGKRDRLNTLQQKATNQPFCPDSRAAQQGQLQNEMALSSWRKTPSEVSSRSLRRRTPTEPIQELRTTAGRR
ncbi:hypothetical protein WMY93_001578 [Mugilogobius chulae]|uniref:Amine oxidase n=1 Tax=Mugilogobius chulae TaxID=88201 RepID=A0AAW0PUM4_9GOBI